MKITHLFTGSDDHSYFEELEIHCDNQHPLGFYSNKYPVENLLFRHSPAGAHFDLHNAPQKQYIIYLEGEFEVTTSLDHKKIFRSGDVLLANDLTGKGHTTTALSGGKTLVITVK